MRARLTLLASVMSGLATAVSAQPLPAPYPPPGIPGQPFPAQPVLALPVLKADLIAKAGADTVRFRRDSYALDPAAQRILDAQAMWLLAHPFVGANIEGHADGRQTRDYALALGERRAAAVRNYLLARGVPPQQLSTVSWGRERPAVEPLHDASWLQNSRVVTVLKQIPQPQPWLPQPQPYPVDD